MKARGALTHVKPRSSLTSGDLVLRIKTPAVSARFSFRTVVICAALIVAIVVLVSVDVSVGQYTVPLAKVVPAMFGMSDRISNFIVQTLRLPEALDAVLAGMAFGISGAIFQSLTRNPLASPDVLGIESGAALAAVFIIVVVGDTPLRVAGAALIGGVATAIVVYVIAYVRTVVSGYRLILIGIAIGATFASVTSYLLTLATYNTAQDAFIWLTGSLNNRFWSDLYPVGIALVILLPFAPIINRHLGVLQLGHETASGLGLRVPPSQRLVLLAASALAAAATASAGPVLFVALVAPQLARRMAQTTNAALGTAGLVGAALMCTADLVGRVIPFTNDLPVGILTGILGAPYLLWYLARSNTAWG